MGKGPSNGGVIASRGFIFQTIVAEIQCLERDDWDAIKVEPETENDKVDIKRSVLEEIARVLKVSVSCLMEENEEALDEAELLAAFRNLKSKKLRKYAIKSIVSMSELESGN